MWHLNSHFCIGCDNGPTLGLYLLYHSRTGIGGGGCSHLSLHPSLVLLFRFALFCVLLHFPSKLHSWIQFRYWCIFIPSCHGYPFRFPTCTSRMTFECASPCAGLLPQRGAFLNSPASGKRPFYLPSLLGSCCTFEWLKLFCIFVMNKWSLLSQAIGSFSSVLSTLTGRKFSPGSQAESGHCSAPLNFRIHSRGSSTTELQAWVNSVCLNLQNPLDLFLSESRYINKKESLCEKESLCDGTNSSITWRGQKRLWWNEGCHPVKESQVNYWLIHWLINWLHVHMGTK